MKNKRGKVVVVSGGFDCLHVGHLKMFQHAKSLVGEKGELIVIVNNDNWLLHKKGYCFYPQQDRVDLIQALKCVDFVYLTQHRPNPKDTSVCSALTKINPDIFANGGDRYPDNVPEVKTCKKLGIEMVWNIGGQKIRSSSDAVAEAKFNKDKFHK